MTAYGPAVTNCRVLDDILDYPEDQILPTCFSHSVLNAASSYVGAALRLHGPAFAIAGFEDAFREAVDLARTLLAGKCCRRVLVIAADEKSMTSEAAETQRLSAAPEFAEGACALVLTLDPGENRCGTLILSDAFSSDFRLPCGIPSGLPAQFADASPDSRLILQRIAPPVWADWPKQ